jgi:hypothetical protein
MFQMALPHHLFQSFTSWALSQLDDDWQEVGSKHDLLQVSDSSQPL